MSAALGRGGVRAVMLATAAGAASLNCSYVSAAVARTLFSRGAVLTLSRFSAFMPARRAG
jgi:hypothetical protein